MESISASFLTTDKAIITKLSKNIKQIEQKMQNLGTKGAWPRSRNLLLNFGTLSISLEWLKLETSNLVCRMTTRSSTKKCKIKGQRGRGLGHVPTFKFRDPLCISGMAKARNVKFGVQNDYKEFYQKMQNQGTKGAWSRSRDLLLNFGTPSISL